MSRRLDIARAGFQAAKTEFDIAMSAAGFSPARADKANDRLSAARAELNNALAEEHGEMYRERVIQNLKGQLSRAERKLRSCEFKLRDAARNAAFTYYNGISDETIETRVSDAHHLFDRWLSQKGLSPTKRRSIEEDKARLGEVSYRLTFVKDARYEVGRITADIKALESSIAA